MMDNLAKTAVAKASFKGLERLPVGVHSVDTVVRIKGTIKVGEDYERTPTVSVPLKETLALFIAYSGITRKAATDALVKAMNDALANSDKGAGALKDSLAVVDETMETVSKSVLSKLKKVPCNGSVTTKLTVESMGELLAKIEADKGELVTA